MPTGVVLPYAGTSAPAGWLTCDGASISRATYPTLFTAIGTAHGTVDGSSFNLPDYRGRFVRGADAMFGGSAAGRDPNAGARSAANSGGNINNAVGSVQLDGMQGHKHAGTGNHVFYGSGFTTASGSAFEFNQTTTYPVPSTDGTNGTPRTTSETRPLNAYVNYIIKI
jgi:microcystin-dependent protein